jgi:hypothetical protein
VNLFGEDIDQGLLLRSPKINDFGWVGEEILRFEWLKNGGVLRGARAGLGKEEGGIYTPSRNMIVRAA